MLGAVPREHRADRFKQPLAQALMKRSSRDFASLTDYEEFCESCSPD